MLLVVPVSYFTIKISPTPEYIFIAQIIICTLAQIVRLIIVKPMIHFSLTRYCKDVIYICTKVMVLSSIIPLTLYWIIKEPDMSRISKLIEMAKACDMPVTVIGNGSRGRNPCKTSEICGK